MKPDAGAEGEGGSGTDAHRPSATTLHLAHAQASIMVVECLMRILIERGVLPLHDVVDTLENAIETERQSAAEPEQREIARVAIGILSTMMNSIVAGSSPRGGGK